MFRKVEEIYRWFETIVTTLLGVISGYFIYEIQLEKNQKWLLAFVVVVLIVLLEKMLHLVFKTLINNSKKLRRILLREHFIEGKWLGKVINTGDSSEVYGYSLVNIVHNDGGFEVVGKVYDLKTRTFTGGFRSNDSHYYSEEQIFTYYFTGYNQYDGSSNDIVGKTRLKVIHKEPHPKEFMGTIFDTKNKNELNTTLFKIDENLIVEHDPNTESGFQFLLEEMM